MKRPYTDAEVKRVFDLRDQGKTWSEIATAVGRGEKALYSKFAKIRRDEQKNPVATKTTKRKYIRTAAVISPTGTTQYRPMIALVGSPSEVTTTIRELFS
jgi:hypothetical protein